MIDSLLSNLTPELVDNVYLDAQLGYAVCYGQIILYDKIFMTYEEAELSLKHMFVPGVSKTAFTIRPIKMSFVKDEDEDKVTTTVVTA